MTHANLVKLQPTWLRVPRIWKKRPRLLYNDSNDCLPLGFNGEPIHLLDGEGTKWESVTSPSVTITSLRYTNLVEVFMEGNSLVNLEYGNLNCSSGKNSRGV
ncbi:hypothetical protein CFP56_006737, partial [Quercus suber]